MLYYKGIGRKARLGLMIGLATVLIGGCGPKSIEISEHPSFKSIEISEHPSFEGYPIYVKIFGNRLSIILYSDRNKVGGTFKLNDLTPVVGQERNKEDVIHCRASVQGSSYTYNNPRCDYLKNSQSYDITADPNGGEKDYFATYNVKKYKEYMYRNLIKVGITDEGRGRLIKEVNNKYPQHQKNMKEIKDKARSFVSNPIIIDTTGFLDPKKKQRMEDIDLFHVDRVASNGSLEMDISYWPPKSKTWGDEYLIKRFNEIILGLERQYSFILKEINECTYWSTVDHFILGNTFRDSLWDSDKDCVEGIDQDSGKSNIQYRVTLKSKHVSNLSPSSLHLSDGRIVVKKDGKHVEIINDTDNFIEIKQVSLYYALSDKGGSAIPFKYDWARNKGAMSPKSVDDISSEYDKMFMSIGDEYTTYKHLTGEKAKNTSLTMGFAVQYSMNGKHYSFFEKKKMSLLDVIKSYHQ